MDVKTVQMFRLQFSEVRAEPASARAPLGQQRILAVVPLTLQAADLKNPCVFGLRVIMQTAKRSFPVALHDRLGRASEKLLYGKSREG